MKPSRRHITAVFVSEIIELRIQDVPWGDAILCGDLSDGLRAIGQVIDPVHRENIQLNPNMEQVNVVLQSFSVSPEDRVWVKSKPFGD